jgi:hypothetical protein
VRERRRLHRAQDLIRELSHTPGEDKKEVQASFKTDKVVLY